MQKEMINFIKNLLKDFSAWEDSGCRDMDLMNGSDPYVLLLTILLGTANPKQIRESIIRLRNFLNRDK